MSIEVNKAIARRFVDAVYEQGNLAVAAELLADDAVTPHLLIFGQPPGRAGIIEGFRMLRAAFPDLTANIEQVVAEGDTVVLRLTLSGTNTGPYRGLPEPTGKRGTMRTVFFLRIRDGRIAEIDGVADRMEFLTQLGILPDIG